jgi:hypothetical protein
MNSSNFDYAPDSLLVTKDLSGQRAGLLQEHCQADDSSVE